MAKIGRNAPCPCGSGKKYKKCCLPLHREADKERARLHAEPASMQEFYDEADELDRLSNSVVDLIDEGRLDEAEHTCEQLRRRFPDQIDWIERLAHVYEAKGEHKIAADYYRKAAGFAQTHEGFDEELIAWHREKADELDPK